MIRNDDGGTELTQRERVGLAFALVAHVLDREDLFEWEDVPELAEREFEALLREIDVSVRGPVLARSIELGGDDVLRAVR